MSVKKGSVYVSNDELIRRIAYQRASGLTQIAWLKYIKVKDVNQIGRAAAQLKSRGASKEEIEKRVGFWVDDIRLFLESSHTERDEFLMWYEEIINLKLNAQERSAGLLKYLTDNDINTDWYFNMLRGYEFFRYCLSIMSPEDAVATMNSGVDSSIKLCFEHPKEDTQEELETQTSGYIAPARPRVDEEYYVEPQAVTTAAVSYEEVDDEDPEDAEPDDAESDDAADFITVQLCRYKDGGPADRSASIDIPFTEETFVAVMTAIDAIVRQFMVEG